MGAFFFSKQAAVRPPATGVVIWYRANGLAVNSTTPLGTVNSTTFVTQWNDLSGNGNHATSTSPLSPQLRSIESIGKNQRPALNFNGSISSLSIGNLALTKNIAGFTMFAVCRSYALINNGNVNEVVYFGTEDEDKGRCSLIIVQTGEWMMRARRVVADGPGFVTGSSDITADTVLCGIVNYATGNGEIYEDDTLVDDNATMTTTGVTANSNSFDSTVGNLSASGLTYPFLGEISEIICVNRAMSATEASRVSKFLIAYYGAPYTKTVYDPVVYAYLAKCTVLPSQTFIDALQTFIAGARADGDLANVKSIYCFKTDTQQQALINILKPGENSAVLAGATPPTFVANSGYTMTGAGYIRLNITPSTSGDFTQNSATMGVHNVGTGTSPGVDFGSFDGTRYIKHYIKWTDNNSYFRINSATSNSVANANPVGWSTLQRTNATNNAMYQNQTQLSNPVANSNGLSTREIYLGCFNNNGATAEFASSNRTYDGFYCGNGNINISRFEGRFNTFLASI